MPNALELVLNTKFSKATKAKLPRDVATLKRLYIHITFLGIKGNVNSLHFKW